MSIAFDTLKYARRLRDAGFPTDQAEAMAEAQNEALRDTLDGQVATKADILKLDNTLSGEMQALDASLRAEMQDTNKRIDLLDANLRAEMQALDASLRAEMQDTNKRIDLLDANLRAEMQAVDTSLRAEMQEVEGRLQSDIRLLRWMVGLVLATTIIPLIRDALS